MPTAISFADPSSVTAAVGFRILPFQTLSISGGRSVGNSAISTVRVPEPQISDLNRGYIDQRNAVKLTVQSNIPWLVRVRTDSRTMGQSFDRTYIKPISDFQLRVEGGRFLTISNADQELLRGDHGSFEFSIDYKTLFDKLTYSNGIYQIDVIYTIVSR